MSAESKPAFERYPVATNISPISYDTRYPGFMLPINTNPDNPEIVYQRGQKTLDPNHYVTFGWEAPPDSDYVSEPNPQGIINSGIIVRTLVNKENTEERKTITIPGEMTKQTAEFIDSIMRSHNQEMIDKLATPVFGSTPSCVISEKNISLVNECTGDVLFVIGKPEEEKSKKAGCIYLDDDGIFKGDSPFEYYMIESSGEYNILQFCVGNQIYNGPQGLVNVEIKAGLKFKKGQREELLQRINSYIKNGRPEQKDGVFRKILDPFIELEFTTIETDKQISLS